MFFFKYIFSLNLVLEDLGLNLVVNNLKLAHLN